MDYKIDNNDKHTKCLSFINTSIPLSAIRAAIKKEFPEVDEDKFSINYDLYFQKLNVIAFI